MEVQSKNKVEEESGKIGGSQSGRSKRKTTKTGGGGQVT